LTVVHKGSAVSLRQPHARNRGPALCVRSEVGPFRAIVSREDGWVASGAGGAVLAPDLKAAKRLAGFYRRD
jgi:hypothetical protein